MPLTPPFLNKLPLHFLDILTTTSIHIGTMCNSWAVPQL